MINLLFLIPVTLLLGGVGLLGLLWALKSGQYDDLDGAAARVLVDDEPDRKENAAPTVTNNTGQHK